jgi:hypothetical protein
MEITMQLTRAKLQAAKAELVMRERTLNQAQLAYDRTLNRINELEAQLNEHLARAEFQTE